MCDRETETAPQEGQYLAPYNTFKSEVKRDGN